MIRDFVAALLALCAIAVPATAQTVSIASQTGGIAPIIANTVAKIVSQRSNLQARAREMGAETQFIPMVDAGQIDMGLSNSYQLVFAHSGRSIFEGRQAKGIRLAFALMPLTVGLAVRADSDIKSLADLKGKRIPGGFTSLRTGQLTWESVIENAGTKASDYRVVPVSGFVAMWNQFKQGRLDVCNVVIGGATAKDVSAAVGGLRFIKWNDDPKSVAAMQAVLPGTTIEAVQPPPEAGQPHPPVNAQFYRYVIFTHEKASADVVYAMTKTVFENDAAFKASGPLWRRHTSRAMVQDYAVPYHDGAIRFYKEKGLWPPAK